MTQAFVCDAIRTPIGRFGGALAPVRTDDLAAHPIAALMARNPGLDWAALDDVYYGCANQAGEDNRNVARMAGLIAGLPESVPEYLPSALLERHELPRLGAALLELHRPADDADVGAQGAQLLVERQIKERGSRPPGVADDGGGNVVFDDGEESDIATCRINRGGRAGRRQIDNRESHRCRGAATS